MGYRDRLGNKVDYPFGYFIIAGNQKLMAKSVRYKTKKSCERAMKSFLKMAKNLEIKS